MNSTKDIRATMIERINMMQKTLDTLPWKDRDFYAIWLSQTYYYVRNATRVLAKAAYHCPYEEEDLHKRLIQSIIEEKSHEIMATNDLAGIGRDIKDYPEFASTMTYHQTLLRLIDCYGSYALPGYFVVLEGLGALGTDEIYDSLVAEFGKESVQFLRVHGRVDKHHFDDGVEYIKSLPQAKQDVIMNAAMISSDLYNKMLIEMRDRYQATKGNTKKVA